MSAGPRARAQRGAHDSGQPRVLSGAHDSGQPRVLLGARPELAWLPLDLLDVDPAYQRDATAPASRARIGRIAAGFDWARFHAVNVARKAPDAAGQVRYAVTDGQHQVAAVRLRNRRVPDDPISEVPCLIADAPAARDQAAAFVAINRERGAVSAVQLHHAQLAAGQADAARLDAVCRAAGVAIGRRAAVDLPAHETLAVGKLQRLLADLGDGPVVQALRVLRQAAQGRSNQLRAELIGAVATFCWRYRKDAAFDEGRLVALLAELDAATWIAAARRASAGGGRTQDALLGEVYRRYHKGLKATLRQGGA